MIPPCVQTEYDGPAGGKETYYAWPGLQGSVQAACTREALNCTLAYVPIPDWRTDVLMGQSPPNPRSPAEILLWCAAKRSILS